MADLLVRIYAHTTCEAKRIKMHIVDLVAGARPNFIKVASLIKAYSRMPKNIKNFEFRLVHTGQHYDHSMSGSFFEQLGIAPPKVNFDVGSGSHSEQTGAIMRSYEMLLDSKRSSMCVVVGDVNSTLACSIVAKNDDFSIS